MGLNLKKIGVCAFFSLIANPTFIVAQEVSGYQKPPQAMVDIVEANVSRSVSFSNSGDYMLILEAEGYPSILDLAHPYLSLAGLRVNPKNYSNNRSTYFSSISIKNVRNGDEIHFMGIPKEGKIKDVTFSPNESLLAFSLTFDDEVQLWLANLSSGQAQRLSNVALNDIYGTLYRWSEDGLSILANCVAEEKLPNQALVQIAPVVKESLPGVASANRTYQDLLKNVADEADFERYLTSQLKQIYLNGQTVNFSRPAIYKSFDYSPDGNYVMLFTVPKPYSYLVPLSHFAHKVELRDKYGKLLKEIAHVPLADNLPQGFDAVVKGPREHAWRADKAHTIFWVEAQDEGDPNKRIAVRDILYTQDAESSSKRKLADCYLRFNYIDWGDDQIAIVNERWWKTRAERRVFIKPGNSRYRVNLWDRYYEDAYSDPGTFVKTYNHFNREVLLLEYNPLRRMADPNNVNVFSISPGASPQGDRPFLLQFNVKTKHTDTLFRSRAPFYELPVFFDNKDKLIVSRESATEPPNYFNLNFRQSKTKQLTYFKNPYPQLFGIHQQKLTYRRADKLALSAMLYLPQDYNASNGRLPVLMWAYPREFKTANAAGQVKGSPYRFNKISWASPLYWVTQGYAVMDNVDMPIVGESNDQPNDTFIEQLQQNAEAAVNKIVFMGIGDAKRIAIGGHSYGAFMTANLLAHTNLFAAGIARSGAYNRTLTPFGFQAEERSYWQSPQLYYKMSPFSYADKIKTPLLLIHGLSDENSGTFPVQSERFYSALKSFGATTRLVNLPYEAHSYRAKESILHLLWEMNKWLDTYVKNKK
ncbi:aminoacyl peptidase [Pelobium manganitolerans]|uniref:Aminoacyl peptidase n=1 Tax=Pelobium manganitolerans TaxID=1842495 RepID=A0A419S451_9SPHI|nr:prolyl oligopeptidase family serine peptidase [Pelobium manganitolerans]RKD14437.1 aminoacyl peptidase [Pelobium manganitolerans]